MNPILIPLFSLIKKAKAKKYIPEIKKEVETSKCIADVALLTTLDYDKHREFFYQYGPDIKKISAIAFKEIENKLLKKAA